MWMDRPINTLKRSSDIVIKWLGCLIMFVMFPGLFIYCDYKVDLETGNDTIEIIDIKKPEYIGELGDKVIKEATSLYIFVLEKQRVFYCHACYNTPDSLVIYPSLYLKRYVTKSERYLFVDFYKYFNAPDKRFADLYYEGLGKDIGILGYDRISFLFDLQNEKWEYIGGKVASEDQMVQVGYDYLEEKSIHNILSRNDTVWIKRYGIEGLKRDDIAHFVVEGRLRWMKEVKEQLSPSISIIEWWE